MPTKDTNDAQDKESAIKAYDIVKADVMRRLAGNMRFGEGREWLREAAMESAERRATTILAGLRPDAMDAIANYITAIK